MEGKEKEIEKSEEKKIIKENVIAIKAHGSSRFVRLIIRSV